MATSMPPSTRMDPIWTQEWTQCEINLVDFTVLNMDPSWTQYFF